MKETVLDKVVCDSNKSETLEGDCSGYKQSRSAIENDLKDGQIADKSPSRDYLVLEHLSSCGLIIAS